MWDKEKKEGVSAVIAVILMVAITVVLAGVLYMWVMQMANPTGTTSATVGGQVHTKGTPGSNYNISVEISSASQNIRITDCVIQIRNPDGLTKYSVDFSGVTLTIGSGAQIYESTAWTPSAPAGAEVKIVDNDGDGNIGPSDWIYVNDSNGNIGLSTGWKVVLRVGGNDVGTWTG